MAGLGAPRFPRTRWRFAAAFVAYASVSFLLFGRGVVGALGDRVVGDAGADKTLYLWALEWWPYALAHGRNPLDVDVAWAPHGFDLGLGTAGGGLAILAAPLTSAVGPVATYNVLMLAAPAVAAAAAFLLIDRVTGAFLPSLVGGYVFGFSSYELGRILGHLPLAWIALVPLAAYVVLMRYRGDLSRGRFVAALGTVLVVQFLILPQVLFTLVLTGALAAVGALLLLPRPPVRRTVAEAAAALGLALVAVSPVIAYAVVSDATAPARSAFAESADVLNYVVPTRRTWLRPPGTEAVAERFTGTGAEHGAYLGLPLLVVIALAARRRPRSRERVLLLAAFAGAVLLSLGSRVKIAGVVVAVGPWAAVSALPVVGSALPSRLTMYAALFAGVLVALALADRPSLARWLLALVGVVALAPNLALPQWSADVPRPRFFAAERYERYLAEGSTVLVLPYGPAGWSMLWQAEAGFRFRLVGGHFGLATTPAEERWRGVYRALGTGRVEPERLRAFLDAHAVDAVVVAPGTRGRVRRAVEAAVGSPPVRSLDALVYELPASSPAARATRDDAPPTAWSRDASLPESLRVRGFPPFAPGAVRRTAAGGLHHCPDPVTIAKLAA